MIGEGGRRHVLAPVERLAIAVASSGVAPPAAATSATNQIKWTRGLAEEKVPSQPFMALQLIALQLGRG